MCTTPPGGGTRRCWDNSARPSGALVFGGREGERLTDVQFALLKAQIEDMHSGSTNAGRPLVLEGGLDWKPLSWTPADMDFIAGKHAAARGNRAGVRRAASAVGHPRGRDLRQLSAKPTPPSGEEPSRRSYARRRRR